jgi:hypothetical protein
MEASNATIQSGIYRHFKGELYEVLHLARHSETQEEHVVYRALYGTQEVWLRPLAMFTEVVEFDGVSVSRFTWVEGSNAPPPRYNRRRRDRQT